MERESKFKEYIEVGAELAAIGSLFFIATGAFNRKSRREIHERDSVCVECGSPHHLECAHFNHARDSGYYNDPKNGRLLCHVHHYIDHLSYRGRADLIGLSEDNNEWAIDELWKNMDSWEKAMVQKELQTGETIVYENKIAQRRPKSIFALKG